jgi:hypothetical protein
MPAPTPAQVWEFLGKAAVVLFKFVDTFLVPPFCFICDPVLLPAIFIWVFMWFMFKK